MIDLIFSPDPIKIQNSKIANPFILSIPVNFFPRAIAALENCPARVKREILMIEPECRMRRIKRNF